MKRKLTALLCALMVAGASVTTAFGAQQSDNGDVAAAASDYVSDGEVVPQISKISPTQSGLRIEWSAFEGAAKYRVFVLTNGTWKTAGETANLYFEHKNLKNNTSYTYTVRAEDGSGKFISGYDPEGVASTFYAVPQLTAVQGVNGGIQVRWNSVAGAVNYRVYRKNGSSWQKLTDTAATSYTDADVSSGNSYSYTVRCMSADGLTFLSHYSGGKTGLYVAVPEITNIRNVANGAKISWNKVAGAAKCRVFVKNGESWKKLGDTASDNYVHTAAQNNTRYTYTVRALDKNGSFASGYNTVGVGNTFLSVPVISGVQSVYGGLKVSWNKQSGAVNYRVYRKNGSSWQKLTDTTATSYTDNNVSSGSSYTYTVRCMSADGLTFLSHYSGTGKKGTYVKAPEISKFENTAKGTKITWGKVSGAAKYRVFVKNGSDWKKLADSSSDNYTHNSLADGRTYTYTVRALDKNGSFVSGYNSNGKSNVFIAPPAISSVTKSGSGMLLRWNAKTGAAKYRIYRRAYDGGWSPLADVAGTSYQDNTAPSNVLYTYTMRCLNANGVSISTHLTDTKFYWNGAIANGKITYKNKAYAFNNGYLRQGYVTIDGKTYYYSDTGTLQKNGIVGSDKDGYRYADSNGVVNTSYCGAVTSNGSDWNVINGKVTKVKTEYDKTLNRALKLVAKVTNSSMTKEQKLKACFNHIKTVPTEKNPRIPHFHGENWHLMYANDVFVNNTGNCMSFGAAFAFMAKALGYNNVYACNSGGHGWAEVEGLIYDPEWARHRFKYSYYGMSYNTKTDVDYKGGISSGQWWMHVKI